MTEKLTTSADLECGYRWSQFTCKLLTGHGGPHIDNGNYLHTEPPEPNHLMHLVLTWAMGMELHISGGWRDRHITRNGSRVSTAAQLAVSALEAQTLVRVAPSSNVVRLTPEGRRKLAEWDIQVAGVAVPIAPTAHTPTCLDDQE